MATLKAEQIKRVKEQFDYLDKDQDGKVTLAEYEEVLRPYVSGEDLQRLIAKANTDGDGVITYDELLHEYVEDYVIDLVQAYIRELEVTLEVEVTAHLDIKVVKFSTKLSAEETVYRLLVDKFDADKDGVLTVAEFTRLIKEKGWSESRIAGYVKKYNPDGDDVITLEDIVNRVKPERLRFIPSGRAGSDEQ